jgi:hypothetical protein
MNIEVFQQKIRQAKRKETETRQYADNIRVFVKPNRKIWTLKKLCEKNCSCNNCLNNGVKIFFKQPIPQLTIFEACTLYLLFKEGRKAVDYGQWHSCPAGKSFINNIEKIIVDGVKL